MALSSFIWHFGKWRVAPKLSIYFKNVAANREGQSKQYDVQKSTPQGHHGTSCATAMFSISKPIHNEVKFRASAERKVGLVLVAVHQKNVEHVRIIILPMDFFWNVKGSINHIKSGHFCLACWVARAVPCSNPFKFPQSMPSIWLVFVFSCLAFKISNCGP